MGGLVYRYLSAPVLSAVYPASGHSGMELTLSGRGFVQEAPELGSAEASERGTDGNASSTGNDDAYQPTGTLAANASALAAMATVTVGSATCELRSLNDTHIVCIAPRAPPGPSAVAVRLPMRGFARTTEVVTFDYQISIMNITP